MEIHVVSVTIERKVLKQIKIHCLNLHGKESAMTPASNEIINITPDTLNKEAIVKNGY